MTQFEMMLNAQAMMANIAHFPLIECLAMLVRSSSHEALPDADW